METELITQKAMQMFNLKEEQLKPNHLNTAEQQITINRYKGIPIINR